MRQTPETLQRQVQVADSHEGPHRREALHVQGRFSFILLYFPHSIQHICQFISTHVSILRLRQTVAAEIIEFV